MAISFFDLSYFQQWTLCLLRDSVERSDQLITNTCPASRTIGFDYKQAHKELVKLSDLGLVKYEWKYPKFTYDSNDDHITEETAYYYRLTNAGKLLLDVSITTVENFIKNSKYANSPKYYFKEDEDQKLFSHAVSQQHSESFKDHLRNFAMDHMGLFVRILRYANEELKSG